MYHNHKMGSYKKQYRIQTPVRERLNGGRLHRVRPIATESSVLTGIGHEELGVRRPYSLQRKIYTE